MRKNSLRAGLLAVILAVTASVLVPTLANAQGRELRFVRDAEIEETIRIYSEPMFEAAGLNVESVDVFLINDKSLNAFVAGGMNMFLHTGLLQEADSPLEVMGVIGHEAGHIAGSHIAGRRQQMERSTAQMIASYVIGFGAALATGRADVAMAAITAGQSLSIGDMLAYSRSQEQAADQAGVTYLERAGYSPEGLLEFMSLMEDQEALLSGSQEPYLRTHPLTRERMRFLQQAASESPHKGEPAPERFQKMHDRMHAKLDGFLEAPVRTLRKYEDEDSVPARYARAIAYFRVPMLEKSLPLIEGLIEEHPDDPYFHELKGQMLFQNGRVDDALGPYRRAVDLRPKSPLLRLRLAEVQVQTERDGLNEPVLDNLQIVLAKEPTNATAWRLKAIAHGRMGDIGESALALSESALARGDLGQARQQSARAQQLLDRNSPAWLRAQDIEREVARRAGNN